MGTGLATMLHDMLAHKEFPMKLIRRLVYGVCCAALLVACDVSSAPTQPTAPAQPTVDSAEPPPAPPAGTAYPGPQGYPGPESYPAPTIAAP
jgi:hypothetical protein